MNAKLGLETIQPRFVIDSASTVIEAILPVDEYEWLVTRVKELEDLDTQTAHRRQTENLICFAAPRKGAFASAIWDPVKHSVQVLKNSRVAKSCATSLHSPYRKLREELIETGVMNEDYVFTSDYTFDHPSMAASIIAGNQRNGMDGWKDMNNKPVRAWIKK